MTEAYTRNRIDFESLLEFFFFNMYLSLFLYVYICIILELVPKVIFNFFEYLPLTNNRKIILFNNSYKLGTKYNDYSYLSKTFFFFDFPYSKDILSNYFLLLIT